MKTTRQWGFEKISLSPIYFNFLRLKYALSALSKVKGTVLEVGGGAGAFTRAIKVYRSDLNIICTDFSPKLIAAAKVIDKNNPYQVADVEHLPYELKSFDATLSFDVIEHLDNSKRAFNETYRVLKKGGVIHCAIPLEGSMLTLHGLMSGVGISPKEKYAGHVNRFTKDQVVNLMHESGFLDIKYKYSGHLFYQITDFLYFLGLNIMGKKPESTFEGFIEELPSGIKKAILVTMRVVMSLIFFIESYIFQDFPGQIGHFTAYKG